MERRNFHLRVCKIGKIKGCPVILGKEELVTPRTDEELCGRQFCRGERKCFVLEALASLSAEVGGRQLIKNNVDGG